MLRAVANRGGGVTNLVIGGSTITGGATTQVLFNLGGAVSSSANMTYSDTLANSGPGLKIGTGSTTSAGLTLGYYGSSGFSGIWSTAVTPDNSNWGLRLNATQTVINSPGATGIVYVARGGSDTFLAMGGAAGTGMALTAGTAVTDVPALSITRTNNNAAVATGIDAVFTDTVSADNFTPIKIRGGDGTRQLLALDKSGGLSLSSAILIKNMVSLASGAGAQTGTLLNAPAAGNPAKFIFIRDNGQTLGIPAWIVP